MRNLLKQLLNPKSNCETVVYELIKLLDIRVSERTIRAEIENHPDNPSLLSVSEILERHGIDNLSMVIEPETIKNVSTPFITQIQNSHRSENLFTIVKDITDDKVTFYDYENEKWAMAELSTFYQLFSGVILIAEAGKYVEEKDFYNQNNLQRKEDLLRLVNVIWLPAIFLLMAFLSFFRNPEINTATNLAISCLTVVGLSASFLLVYYEIDQYNQLLQNICLGSQKTSCGAVLNSKGAKFLGVPWSNIGFTYFAGQTLLLFFSGFVINSYLLVMGVLAIAAIPYILYSVIYQSIVVKKWCVLCLIVQGVILSQSIIILGGNWLNVIISTEISFNGMLQVICCFLIPTMSLMVILPLIRNKKKLANSIADMNAIKLDSDVFKTLLQKQQPFIGEPSFGIKIGNPNGRFKIIKVCNPYCGPCSRAHKPLDELIDMNSNVGVTIIFATGDGESNIRTPPAKHLLGIYHKNISDIRKALDEWYLQDNKDYTVFSKKFPLSAEELDQDDNISKMNEWCQKVGVMYTPIFFVSIQKEETGQNIFYQLPKSYNIKDLEHLFMRENVEEETLLQF